MTARRAGFSAAAWHGAAGLGAAALLRSSFAARAGSARFYLLTTGLAGTWTAGALGAGPVPWRGEAGRSPPARPARDLIAVPVLTGAATFAVFYGAARAARRHRALRRAIARVLRYADAGSTPLVVLITSGSGVAEELFFRGALWSGPRPLRTTTLAYAASTAATGNPALILAGLITSMIFGWQRAATGGATRRWAPIGDSHRGRRLAEPSPLHAEPVQRPVLHHDPRGSSRTPIFDDRQPLPDLLSDLGVTRFQRICATASLPRYDRATGANESLLCVTAGASYIVWLDSRPAGRRAEPERHSRFNRVRSVVAGGPQDPA